MSATPPVLAPDGSGTGAGAAAAGAAGADAAEAALSPGFGSSAAIAGRTVPATSVSAARHSIHFVHFLIYPVITFSFFIPADPEGGAGVETSSSEGYGKLMSSCRVTVFCPPVSFRL